MREENVSDPTTQGPSSDHPGPAVSTPETDRSTPTYEKRRRTLTLRQRVRWLAVPIYFVALVGVLLLIKLGPVDEDRYWPIILLVADDGGLLLLFVLYFPYFRPIKTASLPDGKLVPPPSQPEDPGGIRETNHIWIIDKISVVFWLLFATPAVYMVITGARFDYKSLDTIFGIAAFHFLLIWIFARITAEVDPTGIKVGMGPFKSKTAMEDIESIRTCTIRPIRDFLGWGFRIKADGTRGFIADGNAGIEFTRQGWQADGRNSTSPATVRGLRSLGQGEHCG